jgi:hypothetical protein
MGSSSVNPSNYISMPNNQLQMLELQNQGNLGAQGLANQNQLIQFGANMPIETYNPDIFGATGAGETANKVANVAAFRNKQLEQQQNPEAAKAREALYSAGLQDVSPDFWQKQMDQWTKSSGLANAIQTGTSPTSEFGRSAFYDAATPQGQAFRSANLAQAQQLIGNAPTNAYIDPASAISAQQTAEAGGVQARNNRLQSILGQEAGQNQSTMDWINQMMGSESQAVNAFDQNWQNYNQAMLQGATNNAASQNAMTGNLIGAGGALGGSVILGAAVF